MVTRESCIEKLEQFILDENRIITYKVLSQELKVHTNIAKQYLSDFFTIQKSKNVSLQVCFFLAGIIEIDGRKSMKVLVVSQDNLEKMKKLYSEVTSCHIYSISKGRLDECSILITERHCNDNIGEINKYSSIKHPTIETKAIVFKKVNVVKKDAKSSVSKQQESAPSKNGSSSFFQQNSNNKAVKKSIESVKTDIKNKEMEQKEQKTETKLPEKKDNAEKPKNDPKSLKSNPLASMWQKKDEKAKDNKSENSKPETKGKSKSPPGNVKNAAAKNNIMTMFSRQAAKKSENPLKETVTPSVSHKETEIVTPKEKVKDAPKASQSDKGSKIKNSTKNASTKRKSTNRPSKISSKQKSDNESDDELKPKKKKHRRICTFEDSDSESENEEAQDKAQRSLLDSEDPLESAEVKSSPMLVSEDEEPIPPTPPVFHSTKGRKKVWKTVQKTFQDEDGFFVTKQQKELVSASDSDEDSKASKTTSKDSVKPNLFTYRKQSSLTSFFK